MTLKDQYKCFKSEFEQSKKFLMKKTIPAIIEDLIELDIELSSCNKEILSSISSDVEFNCLFSLGEFVKNADSMKRMISEIDDNLEDRKSVV